MSTYQYVAKDKKSSTVTGILEAASEADAASILHQKELIVLSVKPSKARAAKLHKGKKIKLDDLVVFSRQLSAMLDSGIPLVQVLGILSEQIEQKDLQQVVASLRRDIESGTSFYDALAKHPNVFSELYITMARAGEASGMLNEVLDRLATFLEKMASLTRKIKASLVYPAIIVVMALLITAVLLLKVVPTFKGIFEMLGGELPLPTRVLIMVSDIARHYFLPVVILLVLSGVALKKYINTPKGHYQLDTVKLKVPVLGPLFSKVALARFSRTFSTLVKSGVPVLNALEIVGKTSGNKVIEEAVVSCRNAVREGESISQYLSKTKVFPPLVYRMIGVGEQSGQLEKMLSKIADFYDEQIDAAVSALTSMIEPLVISFLGIFVGGIVISLFLPIFKITELIAK